MAKKKRLNLEKISDEQLVDLFEKAYEEQVGQINSIGEFECTCTRTVGDSEVKMEVMITGLAGTPTPDSYKTGKVEGSEKVVVERDDDTELTFKLEPKDTICLNTNDYLVVYKAS